MIARKRKRPQPDVNSDDEHRKCLKIVTFEGTMDSEIMERKSVIARLDKVSSPDGDYLVIYRANGNFRAFNCLLEVLHIFDRQDLFHLYDLVMEQYSKITLEGIELILWGDLKIMMESTRLGDCYLEIGSQLTLLHGEELASPRSNSSWQMSHWLVQKQTSDYTEQKATGKGKSNLFMAGAAAGAGLFRLLPEAVFTQVSLLKGTLL
ncbi:hypothetical protein Tco_0116576, partial [Tanacetum coccineum]